MANNIDERILSLKKSLSEFNAVADQLLTVNDRGMLEKLENELQEIVLDDAAAAMRNFDALYRKFIPQRAEAVQPVEGETFLTQ